LVINDLSSRNPFIRLGRIVFALFPKFFAPKFAEDLVVDDKIPDKYPVNPDDIESLLMKTGFIVDKREETRLFMFLPIWIDKFIPISNLKIVQRMYNKLMIVERLLLRYNTFKRISELFCFYCKKP